MPVLAQDQQFNPSTNSVTAISVNARIDYILRFSKHPVLVVANEASQSSEVGHQFLGNLPSDHNAAFVSASSKLNNIQLRCRIIEQLFAGCLFDPEQSIAVTIINLLKQHKQKLTIVVDNAQSLTLQVMHELCQLSMIAKKSHFVINVVMLGDYNAGKIIAENQSLFHKKLSILSAQSAQLVSPTAKAFKEQHSILTITPTKIWVATFLLLAIVAYGIINLLMKQDVSQFANLPAVDVEVPTNPPLALTYESRVVNDVKSDAQQTQVQALYSPASVDEVFLAITDPELLAKQTNPQVVEQAQAYDILSALAVEQDSAASIRERLKLATEAINSLGEEVSVRDKITESVSATDNNQEVFNEETVVLPASSKEKQALAQKTIVVNPAPIDMEISTAINNDVEPQQVLPEVTKAKPKAVASVSSRYHQQFSQGYVVQIAGFTQPSIMNEFIADFTDIQFYRYQRRLNDETMMVLTSKQYPTRFAAEKAMSQLPDAILARKPWIKSISAINNEINAFESSQ